MGVVTHMSAGAALLAVVTAPAAAPEGIPGEHIFTIQILAAVIVAVAAALAYLDYRIDSRVDVKLKPLVKQVDALYNHFLSSKEKE